MRAQPPAGLIRHGRLLVGAGIVLVALTLRSAVAALAPLAGVLRDELGVNALGFGVLGVLPPLVFAVFGLATPAFVHRARLETVLVIALAAMVLGHAVRALAPGFPTLLAGTVIALAAMGVGNVLLPPLVKKYFPDRVGSITSLYVAALALSTLVPPLVAVPLERATDWRVSLAVWIIPVVIAAVPWLVHLIRARSDATSGEVPLEEASLALFLRLFRSPTAWAGVLVYCVSSLNVYALFAWLPQILEGIAGVDPAVGGAALSLYAAMGLPAALLVPVLATRLRRLDPLLWVGAFGYVIGYGGLLLAPVEGLWLWVVLAGVGPLYFPLALVIVSLRSASHRTGVALSAFVQGVGYLIASVSPLLIGVLHDLSGEWTLPLVFLLSSSLLGLVALVLLRPGRTVDEELGLRTPLG